MNILAIGAHPDDLEFGCARTPIRHVYERGDRVFLAAVNDGASGGEAEIRRQEQLNSSGRKRFSLGYSDTDANR